MNCLFGVSYRSEWKILELWGINQTNETFDFREVWTSFMVDIPNINQDNNQQH